MPAVRPVTSQTCIQFNPRACASVYIWTKGARSIILGGTFLSCSSPCHVLILPLIGGIESNPGPMKLPCCVCTRTIAKTHRSVQCQECHAGFHIKCANVSPSEYQSLRGRRKIYTCFSCVLPKYNDSFTLNSNDLSTIPSDISDDDVRPENPVKSIKARSLRLGHLNIQGLRSSIDSLRLMMSDKILDCLGISESNLNQSVPGTVTDIPGYQCERKDSSAKLTHGLVFYAKESLSVKRRYDPEADSLDCLWCEVRLPATKPILVGTVYRSPNSDEHHQEQLCQNIASALDCDMDTL